MGDKSTLIVFLRASIDGKAAPINFPLDLVELESLCASHIADKIVDGLFKNGYSIELLQEVIIGFCSDGASVMLGTKSGVGKLLKDKFPDIILWHCLNHRLELAVGNALEIIGGTNDFQSFLEHLYSLYSQSPKNKRELDQCSHDLQTTLKRMGKVFTIRWVASSFRAVSAVWHSFPALAQHFEKASNDEMRQSTEKARFRGILSKFCTINFVKKLALMVDVLNELTNVSETQQSRNTTLPKAHTLLTAYTKRIESLIASPGEHSIMAEQAEKAMSFQQVELREGRSPVINQAQFIAAVADNMKERLFTTASSRAQPSVHATRRENYKTLFGQIDALDPEKIDHENPRFGEDEVKSLCGTLRLNKQQTHPAYIEFKASGGRSIPDQLNKLMVAVDTLSPSNADCERGFSAMNNIITDSRNAITTNNAEKQLFVSTVGPPCEKWNSEPCVRTWLGKGRRAAHATSGMARQQNLKKANYYEPLWKVFK